MLDAKLLPIPQFGFPLARMGSLPVGVGEDERVFLRAWTNAVTFAQGRGTLRALRFSWYYIGPDPGRLA